LSQVYFNYERSKPIEAVRSNNALSSNTSGAKNIAIGGNALDHNTTGSNNIALGDAAGVNAINEDW
jgi:hypothetical protein